MSRAKLIGSAPILLVHDVAASADFYRDRLGFKYNRFWGEPPAFCILHRDQYSIMLSRVSSDHALVPNQTISTGMWDLYFWVDDIKTCYDEMSENGAFPNEEPIEQPHGCIEYTVTDINGYLIAFGQEL